MPRRNRRPTRPRRCEWVEVNDDTRLDTDDLARSLVARGLASIEILDAIPRTRRHRHAWSDDRG